MFGTIHMHTTVPVSDVRSTPKSGHVRCTKACLLWANSGQDQRRKENGGRPTTYSVQRAPPFRANVARFLRRPVEREDRLLFALVRRPLPPYGGTRVSETKGLLKGPTSEEQNLNISFCIALC